MDDASHFLVIRLGPKTSECEKNVTVVSTVTGCDVTNCATTFHGFNKQRSSGIQLFVSHKPIRSAQTYVIHLYTEHHLMLIFESVNRRLQKSPVCNLLLDSQRDNTVCT